MAKRESGGRPPGTTREKKRVTLKQLLRWAYGQQLVDVMTGRTLADPRPDNEPPHETSSDGIAALLGESCRLVPRGAGRARWSASENVHADAVAVHDAVMDLPKSYARLLIEFGRTGSHPERCSPMVRPRPFVPNIGSLWERPGQGEWHGEIVQYRITADETVVVREPVYVRAGRGRMKQAGWQEKRVPVEYCPIEFWPDPVWCEAVNGIAEHWERAMALFRDRLPGLARFDVYS